MLSCFRHTGLSRVATVVVMLAIVWQIILPIFHHPSVGGLARSMVPICAMGMSGMQDNHVNHKSIPPKQTPCPVCQTLNLFGGGYLPSNQVALVLYAASRIFLEFIQYTPTDKLILRTVAQPRAPPVQG